MYKKYIKRILDVLISGIGMLVLSGVYLVVALVVLIFLGRPILYSQERIGKGGKPFKLYKFRSMTNATDENGNLLDEQQRLTKIGTLLRSLSVDELPELWSIFKGDMSIVGPRPLPTYYGPYFTEEEYKRHDVLGGLVPPDGLCGETTPKWEIQFKFDLEYVQNISFLLDLKVIYATLRILVKRVLNNYGAEDRPHLNEYRAEVTMEEKVTEKV